MGNWSLLRPPEDLTPKWLWIVAAGGAILLSLALFFALWLIAC